jgi:hypothetical protein
MHSDGTAVKLQVARGLAKFQEDVLTVLKVFETSRSIDAISITMVRPTT